MDKRRMNPCNCRWNFQRWKEKGIINHGMNHESATASYVSGFSLPLSLKQIEFLDRSSVLQTTKTIGQNIGRNNQEFN